MVVVSFNQKVLLVGEAKDEAIKNQASAEVKAMNNVRSLFNEIFIGPNSTFGARAIASYLPTSIKTHLVFSEDIPSI